MLRSSNITLSKEGYELNFLGKSYARYLSSTKTETFISPDISDNAKEKNKNSENLYIVGDNLDAHQDYIIEPVTSTKNKNGMLIFDEEEARVVRRNYDWYLEGYSIGGIIDKLKVKSDGVKEQLNSH